MRDLIGKILKEESQGLNEEELNSIESFNYACPHPYDFRTD
jgi:hypothetical protein